MEKYFLKRANGLIGKKPIPHTFHNQLSVDVIEKILQLRKEYKLSSGRIKWLLDPYHGINISESSVFWILKKNNVKRLSEKITRRVLNNIRYEKHTPCHHVKVDVKHLIFTDDHGNKIKKFKYTAFIESFMKIFQNIVS